MATRVTGLVTPIPPEPQGGEAGARLRRLRRVAWMLDRSIPVGKHRFGLDPILGLLPGVGDWIGAVLSFYVLYEGARLGLSKRVLAKMGANILVETIIGAVPLLGDIFDFVWQANTRNLALVEQHYRPELRGRPLRKIGFGLILFACLILVLIAGLFFLVFRIVEAAFT